MDAKESPDIAVAVREMRRSVSDKGPASGAEEVPANCTENSTAAAPRAGTFWRKTVLMGIGAVATALVANVAVLAWVRTSFDISNGIATVYTGSCDEMNTIFTWSHLAINIVGTLLLASSNLCMQCLSSPGRSDVDRAHRRRTWLDIGVPSPRNLVKLGGIRTVLWLALALSSIPLHFFWNSILFTSPSQQDFMAVMVSPQFLTGAYQNDPYGPLDEHANMAMIAQLRDNVGNLTRLDNNDCIGAYGGALVSNWRNVLLVTNYQAVNNDTIIYVFQDNGFTQNVNPTDWSFLQPTCNGTILPHAIDDAFTACSGTQGSVSVTVQYCLAEPFNHACTVDVSSTLLSIVVVFNFIKLLCLVATVLILPRLAPLVTLGDAIVSFTRHADPYTAGQGTLSARDVRKGLWKVTGLDSQVPAPRVWKSGSRSWSRAASPLRWISGLSVILLVFIAGLAMIGATLTWDGSSWIWTEGLGQANPQTLISITGNQPLLSNVLIANAPQLLVSGAYLSYNALLTSMLLGSEWSQLSTAPPSSLRVSRPTRGSAQEGRYFLSLPLRFALPLMAVSALLHWLVSQAIFVVQVTHYDNNGNATPQNDISACGWSIKPMVGAAVVGLVMILAMVGLMSRRLQRGIPVVGSCSAAIAACCRVRTGEEDVGLGRVLYGMIGLAEGEGGRAGRAGMGGREVAALVEGQLYS